MDFMEFVNKQLAEGSEESSLSLFRSWQSQYSPPKHYAVLCTGPTCMVRGGNVGVALLFDADNLDDAKMFCSSVFEKPEIDITSEYTLIGTASATSTCSRCLRHLRGVKQCAT